MKTTTKTIIFAALIITSYFLGSIKAHEPIKIQRDNLVDAVYSKWLQKIGPPWASMADGPVLRNNITKNVEAFRRVSRDLKKVSFRNGKSDNVPHDVLILTSFSGEQVVVWLDPNGDGEIKEIEDDHWFDEKPENIAAQKARRLGPPTAKEWTSLPALPAGYTVQLKGAQYRFLIDGNVPSQVSDLPGFIQVISWWGDREPSDKEKQEMRDTWDIYDTYQECVIEASLHPARLKASVEYWDKLNKKLNK